MTTAGADPESKSSSLKDKANAAQEKVKAAAKAAALAAEKTKITTVSLPIAYTALAQDCYKAKRWEKDFPEQYNELNQLAAQIAESKKKSEEEIPAGESVMNKAKSLASKGAEAAKVQKLKLSTKSALAKFGEAVFQKHGVESGPAEFVTVIERLRTRLAELEEELGEQVGKAGGARWLKKAAVVVAVVLVIGAFMGKKDAKVESGAAKKSAQTADSGVSPDNQKGTIDDYRKLFLLNDGMTMGEIITLLGEPTCLKNTSMQVIEKPVGVYFMIYEGGVALNMWSNSAHSGLKMSGSWPTGNLILNDDVRTFFKAYENY